jgi:dipeptidyl aminopeptidase/acylaminoacyl peptidase
LKNRIIGISFATALMGSAGLEAASPLTAQQALERRGVSELRFSPDGKHLAMTVSEPYRGTERNRDIWLYDRVRQESWPLTASEKSDHSPRWSPDGETLAFLSSRTEKAQVHLISLRGGEAQALTQSETPVTALEWAPDGRSIAFLAAEPKNEEQKKKEEDKDDPRVVDRDDRPPQLWLVDLESREARQVTSGQWRFSSLDWMPDGTRIVAAATDHPQPELLTTRIYAITPGDGSMEELHRPDGPMGDLDVSPDGQLLAYVGSRGDGPDAHDLLLLPIGGGASRNLTSSSIDRPVSDFAWQAHGGLLVQVADGFTSHFYDVTLEGEADRRPTVAGPHPLGAFAAKQDLLAFVGETATQAPEVWLSSQPGQAEKVTDLNAAWDAEGLVEPEILTYASFDGTSIEAALLKPERNEESGPLPVVVLVHGGPSGRWASRFHSWGQLLVARGFAVLYPNIRGSVGYGHDFLVANHRDWGGGDFRDVMAGIDFLVEQRIADPERLGIGGWSYGGYMAAWAVTQTGRFRASVSGAPMTDLASEYGTETSSINAYDTWYLGTPYENLGLFAERSPITHVRNATTPTLILCGENDVIDPIGQCWQFYRGLKRYEVGTELVIYPREGHGIREEKHQLDLLHRVIDWYERHLATDRQASP